MKSIRTMKPSHMLLCGAVVVLGVVLLATGGGSGGLLLVPLLFCGLMMGGMMWMMMRPSGNAAVERGPGQEDGGDKAPSRDDRGDH